ncbi:MAG: CAP domain-containing protein [Peptococcia bacterium]
MTYKRFGTLLVMLLFMVCTLVLPAQSVSAEPWGTVSIGTRQMTGNTGIYELLINEQVVVRYRSAANGYSAARRAQLIMERIKGFGSEILTKPLRSGIIEGSPVILLGDKLLITVTKADWEANNSSGMGLAEVWRDNLHKALHNEYGQNTTWPVTPTPMVPSIPSETTPDSTLQKPEKPITGVSQEEQDMVQLINKERAAAGLAPLQIDPKLVEIARLKSQDMITNNYFAHNSPTYGDPFAMMKSFGVSFVYAGENLAGNPSMTNAHEDLMNSPGHRANILNSNYTHVGVGIVEGGVYGKMFTQLFVSY